jgi:HAE1 family hydrophobic/amphiphilic exporter-1
VFGGMLAASLVGIFLIPMLYVVFQWLREKVTSKPAPAPPRGEQPGVADAPSAAE